MSSLTKLSLTDALWIGHKHQTCTIWEQQQSTAYSWELPCTHLRQQLPWSFQAWNFIKATEAKSFWNIMLKLLSIPFPWKQVFKLLTFCCPFGKTVHLNMFNAIRGKHDGWVIVCNLLELRGAMWSWMVKTFLFINYSTAWYPASFCWF